MTAATLAQTITVPDPVRQWRLEELERAGYPTHDALVLSGRNDVDIHLAASLLARGCPVKTAMGILV